MSHKVPQILTVDDDAVTCELLCEVFTREGFDATFAKSGEDALVEVARHRPDLLLSDIRMNTRLDGLSPLASLRRALAARNGKELVSELDEEDWSSGLVGRTPPMLEVYKMIARVSDSRAAVLVTGESGTGKEVVGREIDKY